MKKILLAAGLAAFAGPAFAADPATIDRGKVTPGRDRAPARPRHRRLA